LFTRGSGCGRRGGEEISIRMMRTHFFEHQKRHICSNGRDVVLVIEWQSFAKQWHSCVRFLAEMIVFAAAAAAASVAADVVVWFLFPAATTQQQ
jgi:hypothetical protein